MSRTKDGSQEQQDWRLASKVSRMNERERELRAIECIDRCLAWHDLDPGWVDRLLDDRLILMEDPPRDPTPKEKVAV